MIPVITITLVCLFCLVALAPLALVAYYGRLANLIIPIVALFGALVFAGIGAGLGWIADIPLGSEPTGLVIGAVIGGFVGAAIGTITALRGPHA